MLAKELSKILAQRALEIVQMLYPNGKKEGNEWCVGSIDGESGRSTKIHLIGDKAGLWCDFNSGDKGDLLDLWSMRYNLSISESMKQAAKYCNVPIKKIPYSDKKKKFIRPELKPLPSLKPMSPVHQYLSVSRGLEQSVLEVFKIPHSNDEIIFNYYRDNELIFVKNLKLERKNGDKQMYVSADAEPCLFGWQTIPANARSIVICEGEIDAMSFYQYGVPALSVPFGGGKGDKQRWIQYEYERLNQFDDVLVCMDNDEAGIAGAKEIIERLGAHRCRIVELPMKDANDCLVNGISVDDIKFCLSEAKTLDPDELIYYEDFTDLAYELHHPIPGKFLGYTLGFDKCGNNILFNPSGLTIWTGYNGHGKTLFLGQIMLNMIKQGARFCVASMELLPEELMARTYCQASGCEKPTRKYIDAINIGLQEKLYLFNIVGTGKIERLLEVFLYARKRYGLDVFIIDSLATLSIAEDDYNGHKNLMEMLRDFKMKHRCHIHLVAHPRKPRDEKEIPGRYDIRGGSTISDFADNCLSVWRNKEKEELKRKSLLGNYLTNEEIEKMKKPDVYLKCDKNRHGRGKSKDGIFGFWFNEPSYQYLEREGIRPIPFIDYSCQKEN